MKLGLEWEYWRRIRQRELVAGGMARALARRLARAEAKGRARIGRMTGFEAAAKAPLDYREEAEDSTTWLIWIDPALIPTGRREAVRRFLFEHGPAAN